jgi:hypothetical protein
VARLLLFADFLLLVLNVSWCFKVNLTRDFQLLVFLQIPEYLTGAITKFYAKVRENIRMESVIAGVNDLGD